MQITVLQKKLNSICQKNGAVCLSSNQEQTGGDTDYRYTDARQIPTDTECIIVLGGDGTLIQAARDVNKTNIPLLGVNIGTLGYLTDADRSTVYEALNCCMQDTYEIDTRMMLSGTIYRDGEPVFENTALNDIVISRCGTLRVIDFDVHRKRRIFKFLQCGRCNCIHGNRFHSIQSVSGWSDYPAECTDDDDYTDLSAYIKPAQHYIRRGR